MCEQSPLTYLDGDVVWVKLGNCWWPGEVCGESRLPEGLLDSIKKQPIAVVKFFQENTFEYVKNINNIYKYNCSKKNEFIKRGLDLYRANNKYMDKFPADVSTAEQLTGGDPDILSKNEFAPNRRPNYSTIFGEPSKKLKKGKGSPGKKSKPTIQGNIERKMPIIPHPRIYKKSIDGTPDHEIRILAQPSSSTPRTPTGSVNSAQNISPGAYKCHLCNFSSNRLNVIVLHTKNHKNEPPPVTPKGKLGIGSPQKNSSLKKPTPKAKTNNYKKQSDESEKKVGLQSTPSVKDIQQTSITNTYNHGKRKKNNDVVDMDDDEDNDDDIIQLEKKPKTETEIKSKLLADWSEDEDEDDDDEDNREKVIVEIVVKKNLPVATQSMESQDNNIEAQQEPTRLGDELAQFIKNSDSNEANTLETQGPILTDKSNTAPKYRNIPKKDRRDIVLREFSNGDLLTAQENAVKQTDSKELSDELTSPITIDENIEQTSPRGPPRLSPQLSNDENEQNIHHLPVKEENINKSFSDFIPPPPPPPLVQQTPTDTTVNVEKISTEKPNELSLPPPPPPPPTPAKQSMSCFDFEEEDDNEDFLTSFSKLKKKFMSPDKNKEPSEPKAHLIEPDKKEIERKDNQLSAAIENLLSCTKPPEVNIDMNPIKTSPTEVTTRDVRALPPKERGKRIFKSRNRSRYEEPTIESTAAITVDKKQSIISEKKNEVIISNLSLVPSCSSLQSSSSLLKLDSKIIADVVVSEVDISKNNVSVDFAVEGRSDDSVFAESKIEEKDEKYAITEPCIVGGPEDMKDLSLKIDADEKIKENLVIDENEVQIVVEDNLNSVTAAASDKIFNVDQVKVEDENVNKEETTSIMDIEQTNIDIKTDTNLIVEDFVNNVEFTENVQDVSISEIEKCEKSGVENIAPIIVEEKPQVSVEESSFKDVEISEPAFDITSETINNEPVQHVLCPRDIEKESELDVAETLISIPNKLSEMENKMTTVEYAAQNNDFNVNEETAFNQECHINNEHDNNEKVLIAEVEKKVVPDEVKIEVNQTRVDFDVTKVDESKSNEVNIENTPVTNNITTETITMENVGSNYSSTIQNESQHIDTVSLDRSDNSERSSDTSLTESTNVPANQSETGPAIFSQQKEQQPQQLKEISVRKRRAHMKITPRKRVLQPPTKLEFKTLASDIREFDNIVKDVHNIAVTKDTKENKKIDANINIHNENKGVVETIQDDIHELKPIKNDNVTCKAKSSLLDEEHNMKMQNFDNVKTNETEIVSNLNVDLHLVSKQQKQQPLSYEPLKLKLDFENVETTIPSSENVNVKDVYDISEEFKDELPAAPKLRSTRSRRSLLVHSKKLKETDFKKQNQNELDDIKMKTAVTATEIYEKKSKTKGENKKKSPKTEITTLRNTRQSSLKETVLTPPVIGTTDLLTMQTKIMEWVGNSKQSTNNKMTTMFSTSSGSADKVKKSNSIESITKEPNETIVSTKEQLKEKIQIIDINKKSMIIKDLETLNPHQPQHQQQPTQQHRYLTEKKLSSPMSSSELSGISDISDYGTENLIIIDNNQLKNKNLIHIVGNKYEARIPKKRKQTVEDDIPSFIIEKANPTGGSRDYPTKTTQPPPEKIAKIDQSFSSSSSSSPFQEKSSFKAIHKQNKHQQQQIVVQTHHLVTTAITSTTTTTTTTSTPNTLTSSTPTDDSVFDITNMPILLANELTQESLDKMEIVIAENPNQNQPQQAIVKENIVGSITPPITTTKTKRGGIKIKKFIKQSQQNTNSSNTIDVSQTITVASAPSTPPIVTTHHPLHASVRTTTTTTAAAISETIVLPSQAAIQSQFIDEGKQIGVDGKGNKFVIIKSGNSAKMIIQPDLPKSLQPVSHQQQPQSQQQQHQQLSPIKKDKSLSSTITITPIITPITTTHQTTTPSSSTTSTCDRIGNVISSQTILPSKNSGNVLNKISSKGQVIQAGAGGQIVITSKGTVIATNSCSTTVTSKSYTGAAITNTTSMEISRSQCHITPSSTITTKHKSGKQHQQQQQVISQQVMVPGGGGIGAQKYNQTQPQQQQQRNQKHQQQSHVQSQIQKQQKQLQQQIQQQIHQQQMEQLQQHHLQEQIADEQQLSGTTNKGQTFIKSNCDTPSTSGTGGNGASRRDVIKVTQRKFAELTRRGLLEDKPDGKVLTPTGIREMQQQNLIPPKIVRKQNVKTTGEYVAAAATAAAAAAAAAESTASKAAAHQPNIAVPPLAPISDTQIQKPSKKKMTSHSKEKIANAGISAQPPPPPPPTSSVAGIHQKQEHHPSSLIQMPLEPAATNSGSNRSSPSSSAGNTNKQTVEQGTPSPDLSAKYGDGNLLAVPGETFGGPPNSFYLCTMADNDVGFSPIDNQPLYLDASNQLVPMLPDTEVINIQDKGTGAECQLQIQEAGVSGESGEQQIMTDLSQLSDGGNQTFLINTADGHQILLDQQSLLALVASGSDGAQLVTPDGQQLILPPELLTAIGLSQTGELAGQILLSDTAQNQDILAAALAGTEVYQQEQLISDVLQIETSNGVQIVDQSSIAFQPLNQPVTAQTNETNAILTQPPIMSTLEVPSNNKQVDNQHLVINSKTNETGLIGQNLEDSLAVIGVTTQASELPITVTNPAIAPKTTGNPISLGGIYGTTGLAQPPPPSQISPSSLSIGNSSGNDPVHHHHHHHHHQQQQQQQELHHHQHQQDLGYDVYSSSQLHSSQNPTDLLSNNINNSCINKINTSKIIGSGGVTGGNNNRSSNDIVMMQSSSTASVSTSLSNSDTVEDSNEFGAQRGVTTHHHHHHPHQHQQQPQHHHHQLHQQNEYSNVQNQSEAGGSDTVAYDDPAR